MKFEKSAGAVMFRFQNNERLFLLLRYSQGHWGFPKGHVEKNETELETLSREIEEETKIKQFDLNPKFRETIFYYFTNSGQKVRKEVVFYLAETNKKEVSLSVEHIDFDWLSFEKAFEKLSFSNTKSLLKKAELFLNKN